jgi:hypothetical protein
LKVLDRRLERRQALLHIEINLVCEAAGNATLTELSLRVDVSVKLVGIARKVGVVADDLRFVWLTSRAWARNDRLQLADLAILEGVKGFH